MCMYIRINMYTYITFIYCSISFIRRPWRMATSSASSTAARSSTASGRSGVNYVAFVYQCTWTQMRYIRTVWDHRARVLSMRIEMCSYVISDGLEVRLGEGHDRLEGDQAWSGHRQQGITCDMYFCYVRKHFIPRCLQQIKLRQNH